MKSVKISEESWKSAKIYATNHNTTIQEVVEDGIKLKVKTP